MEKIYCLSDNARWNDPLRYTSNMQIDSKVCPGTDHASRERWNRPLKVVAPVRALTDFEWTIYGDLIVDQKVAESLKGMGFSGMRFLPVELHTTQTPFGREAYELNVTGWGGMASPASGIRVSKECPACGRQVFSEFTNPSRLFNFDEWDGSDFFIIWPLPRFVMITGRVRDYILKQAYSGVKICPIERLQKSIAGGFAPGHISDWFGDPKVITDRE